MTLMAELDRQRDKTGAGYNSTRWPNELLRDIDKLSTESFRYAPHGRNPRQPIISSKDIHNPAHPKPLRIPVNAIMTDPIIKLSGGDGPKKSLVLCFDGTGNKFSGTPADSNIVKIFSLLDREDAKQFHYYQPGIGTYVETGSLAQKSRMGRIKSWYMKAKDQAVGTSFGEHVMAGYKFLMRYYSSGDDIYFFGFSRGAYTARFLAELLDYVGLLSAGNEEMLRFAWKTFARWQMRTDETEEEKKKKRETFRFMKKFRETFSRPIDRIRFIGLFDCVNSVPQFETAWMTRTKFPYTAKTSAQIIRHAVSIDERRAKFRQDLMSGQKQAPHSHDHHAFRKSMHWRHHSNMANGGDTKLSQNGDMKDEQSARYRRKSPNRSPYPTANRSPNQYLSAGPEGMASSTSSLNSAVAAQERTREVLDMDASFADESDAQDLLEVWFAGQHGDIGGGWTLGEGERRPASDLPLIWMLREARKAGMPFDENKLMNSDLFQDDIDYNIETPLLQLDGRPLNEADETGHGALPAGATTDDLIHLQTQSKIHDALAFGGGSPFGTVLAWQFMEHIPFRRMDLQPDGSWKPISWPLPRGEVRDMPTNAIVHGSVIRRMKADSTYRPGNLIVGGGGRGVRKAPESAGTGLWRIIREDGHLLGEAVVKIVEGQQADEKS